MDARTKIDLEKEIKCRLEEKNSWVEAKRGQEVQMGVRLKQLRLILNYQQVDFAKILGISKSSLCRLEKGEQGIQLKTCFKLNDYFCCDLNWLFTGKGKWEELLVGSLRELYYRARMQSRKDTYSAQLLGERLYQFRNQKCLTRKLFLDELSENGIILSETVIGRYENAENETPSLLLRVLHNAWGIDLNLLISGRSLEERISDLINVIEKHKQRLLINMVSNK